MEIGQKISFDLDTWPSGSHKTIHVEAEILSICHDPSKRHESKCIINFKGDKYGIPFSEIKQIFPACGEQLFLF